MPDDICQTCTCTGDHTTMCQARKCLELAKPTCSGGKEPSIVYDIEGCCPTYKCDCNAVV